MVAVETNPKPYIDALMPRDQVFEEEEYNTHVRKRKKVEVEEGDVSKFLLEYS